MAIDSLQGQIDDFIIYLKKVSHISLIFKQASFSSFEFCV